MYFAGFLVCVELLDSPGEHGGLLAAAGSMDNCEAFVAFSSAMVFLYGHSASCGNQLLKRSPSFGKQVPRCIE
jgi:hypothetical protein